MAVTAQIGGAGAGYSWTIQYDDTTKNVTGEAAGTGHGLVTVQITNSITRTVAFEQPGVTNAAADITVTIGTGPQVLRANVSSGQVNRIVSKPGGMGGLVFTEQWWPA